jgi:dolichol-phosphate mannosyltransferase
MKTKSSKRKLDIITSAYNEQECIPELYKRIIKVMQSEIEYDWKLTMIDNGSSDSTWNLMSDLAQRDSRVRAVRMSRNFSLDAAFTCGLDKASGDAAIIMCSDLQDPPEIIPAFLRQFESGFGQVVARINNRPNLPLIRKMASKFFYKIADRLTKNRIPQNVSDFRLMSRTCYVATRQLREQHRFMRGLSAWVGFDTAFVDIDRPPRFGGESQFLKERFSNVFQWAFQGILSHTVAPLIWISALGLIFSALSIFSLIFFLTIWITVGFPFAGFLSIISSIALGFSVNLLFLGIISQYLALVVEEVKKRPLYVVAEEVG